MLKVRVWSKEEGEDISLPNEPFRYLRPRMYMLGWNYEKVLEYVKKECEWYGIKLEDITSIEFYDKEQQWTQSIQNPKVNA